MNQCHERRAPGAIDEGVVHLGVNGETAFGKTGNIIQSFDNIGFPKRAGHVQWAGVQAGNLNA